ncbi:DUF4214 domain-containing protein, partial [Salipiger abyssi]|uniref:DUF4214 domain-containing protein n=1 Tax=Salipiger abyssi TaxID=1250539 RepID=UPI001A8F5B62
GTTTHSGTDVDWYRFDSLSGEINVTMNTLPQANGEMQNLNIALFDAAGNAVRAGQGDATSESLSHLVATEGTYYLRVLSALYPDGAPNGFTLDYELELDLPEEQVSDGNDTQATAELLAAGTTTHSGTDVDWYRFDSLSGEINVTMNTLPQANGEMQNLNIALFDAAGNAVRAGQGNATSESLSYIAPTDGTYYLRVLSALYPGGAPNGFTLDYELELDLPEEQPTDGNDTRAAADLVETGSYRVSGTDVDWYRIETGPGLMEFMMTAQELADGSVQDLNMILYDSEGTGLRANLADGPVEAFSYTALTEGTYYLRVNWARYAAGTPNGLTMEYQLDLDLPEGTWAKALDFGPIRASSVAAYDIDKDGRDEIFVGTSKSIDSEGNEVRPAGFIAMKPDGRVIWSQTFAASPGVDVATGKTYQTSSVSTAPTFSDLDDDGSMDIVVGVGADNGRDEFGVIGQPGDMGGVYALNADGSVKWFFQTRDSFGDDGRSEGLYAAPRVFDIDADGVREVIITSWDHYLYVLDGRTGALEREANLHDTAGAVPNLADVDNDGLYELVVASDISANAQAGIDTQGGLLQVLSNYGIPNVPGWADQIGETTSASFRGKFEEQSLWSSPQIVDLDRDGTVEIVQGTGDYFKDERGQYIKVWNADGSLRFERATHGRVLAAPLIADLDGNGSSEIIAVTTDGFVHAWNAGGVQLFATKPMPVGSDDTGSLQIVRSPVAVDINNDGKLEILVSIGNQMLALNSNGKQVAGHDEAERVFNTYAGSPLVKDVDDDGALDLISGGTLDGEQAVVFRFENPFEVQSDTFRTAAYQGNQSLNYIRDFVDRFYETILGRDADPSGSNNWTDRLYAGVRTGADVARGFIFSPEFTGRRTSNMEFVETLYHAFFDREPNAKGLENWTARLDGGMSRADVLEGFIGSQEFANLASSYGIRADSSYGAAQDEAVIVGDADDANTLRAGDGNSVIYDEGNRVEDTNPDKTAAEQVFRLYGATLGRTPDARGFENNVGNVMNRSLQGVAGNFVNSAEFQRTYGDLDDEGFVTLLYQNVLGRDPDAKGLENWATRLEDGVMTRAQVVLGFSESTEYKNNTEAAMDYFMRSANLLWTDVIEGGAGNDTANGGFGADIFVFRADQTGNDVIHGFEPWDELQLSGFGFETPSDAMARMSRSGNDVVFSHRGQTITFVDTKMSEMDRVRYNLS